MSLTSTYYPTEFTCATCGSGVELWTETMWTSAYPAGKVRNRKYVCRRDRAHDLGTLEVPVQP